MCHNAGILSQTPRKNFSLLVARVLLRHFIAIKFILVSFVLLWFFYLFFKRVGGVIAFALLSVHKSAVEPIPCIRLARLKFELTNQHSADGKNFSVLTS